MMNLENESSLQALIPKVHLAISSVILHPFTNIYRHLIHFLLKNDKQLWTERVYTLSLPPPASAAA
jgi:hypothetical protein